MNSMHIESPEVVRFLKPAFWKLFSNLAVEDSAIQILWNEIEEHYSKKHRAYHNLNHLFDLFNKLEDHKTSIFDLPALQMSIWYHDIIYQALSKQNEIKSAILCSKRLKENRITEINREKVFKLIASTKQHQLELWETKEQRSDNAYLLDLDLSILGSDQERYKLYIHQVREEYKFVPSFLYNHGRKKVLDHFLKMDRIFKTDYFFEKYESQAIENMRMELEGKKTIT